MKPTPALRTLIIVLLPLLGACAKQSPVTVGSKNFTESVILGELVAQKLESAGCKVDRRLNMGGTFVCDAAIRNGQIDSYVEYSGTALSAILKVPKGDIESFYAKAGLHWGPALGFNNTFAMIVRKADADRLGLHRISDLAKVVASFRPGFGYEFVERADGWTGLQRAYRLPFATSPETMDLGLTYNALASRAHAAQAATVGRLHYQGDGKKRDVPGGARNRNKPSPVATPRR